MVEAAAPEELLRDHAGRQVDAQRSPRAGAPGGVGSGLNGPADDVDHLPLPALVLAGLFSPWRTTLSRHADELNRTSFAMLGMLAIRPWSTYELAKHVDRSLGSLWPRARSNPFNEPEKLVAKGAGVRCRRYRRAPATHDLHPHPGRAPCAPKVPCPERAAVASSDASTPTFADMVNA